MRCTKMYLLLFVLLILASIFGCNKPKPPTFLDITNVRFESFKDGAINLSANAMFNNPNGFKVKIIDTDLDISIDGNKISKIVQVEDSVMPANSDFSVPLNISIAPKDLKGGLFGSAFAMLTNKTVKVRYQGTVKVQVLKIPFKVPVDSEQDVKLNGAI